ncbi:MAG: hypothetical protein GY796_21930 [Chloroflexi bacterium]|nr:hypothetical protein [Chloroflexota bacterium]
MMMNRHQLRDDLVANFSKDELAQLSSRLGINFASLGGKSLSDKAGSLIGKVERSGRLPDLMLLLVQERPQLKPRYQKYLQPENSPRDNRLDWLDRMAAGEGQAIEEPPTMRWDSSQHPRQEDKE